MKHIKIIAAAAAIALPLQFAQAQDATLNAQLVIPDVDGFDGGTSIAIGYEMPMPDVDPNFSIEGELTKSLSSPEVAGFEYSYFSLSGYGKYTHEVDTKFSLYGRAGLTYTKVEFDTTSVCYTTQIVFGIPVQVPSACSTTASDTDTGLSFGFGMNYALNPQMDFTAGYTILHKDINHLSAGIKYKL